MNFNTRLRETTNRLKELSNVKDINGKYIIDSADDVYNSVVEDFYKEFDLPALWLDETGFGTHSFKKSDIDEFVRICAQINEKYGTENEEYVTPMSAMFLEEENDYDYDEIAKALDTLLIERYEKALETLEASILEVKEEDLIKNLREAYETMYNFDWTGWGVHVFLNLEDGSFYTSEIVSLNSTIFPKSFTVSKVEAWALSNFDFDECDEDDFKSEKIDEYISNYSIEKAKETILEGIECGEITKRVVWID